MSTKSKTKSISESILEQAAKALSYSDESTAIKLQYMEKMLNDFKPQTEMETLLLSQTLMSADIIVDCIRTAYLPEQTQQVRHQNLLMAAKYNKIFADQMQNIYKLRGERFKDWDRGGMWFKMDPI